MLSFTSAADPLGSVCVPTTAGMMMPAFIARLHGTTKLGPFASEVYVSECARF